MEEHLHHPNCTANPSYLHRICALSAAAEFVESTTPPNSSVLSFPHYACTLANSSSSSGGEITVKRTATLPKIVFGGSCKAQIRDISAKGITKRHEEWSNTSSELSSLSSAAVAKKSAEKSSQVVCNNEIRSAARLSHLAAVACSNSASCKAVRKLRSARTFKPRRADYHTFSTDSTGKRSLAYPATMDSSTKLAPEMPNSLGKSSPVDGKSPNTTSAASTCLHGGSPSPQPIAKGSRVTKNASSKVKIYFKKRQTHGPRIHLIATNILKYLLDGNSHASEKAIRQTFGNNPDTSKALRMLVKQDRVKRYGVGGRQDPFVYVVIENLKEQQN